jgi:hypothetical protein
MLLCVLTLCQRKHRLSHYLLVETRGTLFQLIIVSESLPIASKSCIIVANMDDKFFSADFSWCLRYRLRASSCPPSLLSHPLRSVCQCCLNCYDRGTVLPRTLPLPLSPLPPCRTRSFSLLHAPSIMLFPMFPSFKYVPAFSS